MYVVPSTGYLLDKNPYIPEANCFAAITLWPWNMQYTVVGT